MIRVSYWQFRLPLAIALGGLTVVAVIAGLTGPGVVHLYDTTVANCAGNGGDCSTALSLFNAHDQVFKVIAEAIPLGLPAVLGMFWGAPLVARELESGTFRLAWTQGRSRLSWLGAKLAVVGLAALAVQGLISLALTWWWNPVGHANHNRFSPVLFGAFGIVPIGYAAFALALGITAGVVIRRTLPAMAVTLAVFVGVRLAVTLWVRPYFAAPARLVLPISSNQAIGIDSPARGQSITYQPASRYWPFQWAELGLFTALALGLAAFSAWWICRWLI
jgi:ABC-type transport system involved in multi-copper enzyme maturation permease subunit